MRRTIRDSHHRYFEEANQPQLPTTDEPMTSTIHIQLTHSEARIAELPPLPEVDATFGPNDQRRPNSREDRDIEAQPPASDPLPHGAPPPKDLSQIGRPHDQQQPANPLRLLPGNPRPLTRTT